MEFTLPETGGLGRLPEFVTALALGLLIGLERERHAGSRAGLRTFALIALSGAACMALAGELAAPLILVAGLLATAAVLVSAHYRDWAASDVDPGSTTMAAGVACFLFGAMAAIGWSALAVMLAIGTTALLYFKTELGGFARNLERRDIISILQFGVVTFIVLPLLPDRDMGPFGALNPRHVWWMVVLISGVSLAGYVALRWAAGRKPLLLGVLGGMVSSTATTLSYARYGARKEFELLAVRVIIAANLMVLVRIAVLAAIVAPGVLRPLALPLGAALVAGLVAYAASVGRANGSEGFDAPHIANPVELRSALGFAGLYAVVLVVSAWLADLFGSSGVYLTAAASGVTDVDAISLSSMRMAQHGGLSSVEAAHAVAVALCANLAFKSFLVLSAGGRRLLRQCAPGFAAVAAGLVAGIVLQPA